MSKYIIEIKPEYEDKFKGVMILGAENSNLYVDSNTVDELEELTADYINEHYGDLQDDAYNKGYAQCQDDYSDALKHAKDTAYKKGLHDGESKCGYCNEYQRGLDDAWEAARKIAEMWETIDNDELLGIFGLTAKIGESTIGTLFKKQTASEAIEKLKAYEEKQKADDKIEVGDEVEPFYTDVTGVVTLIDGDTIYILWRDGSSTSAMKLKEVTKTGRHFDIAKILEAMKND